MTTDRNVDNRPPHKKPLWPWLLLLILTLAAIYSWNRASELFEEFSRNMPAEIIELFRDLLREHQDDGHTAPKLDVSVPTRPIR
ncbi:hypothetical protein GGQ73_003797 [Rhizobium skierniewicense]|uniref:Uncharacterized protein n=1 Tax=Rhizobium skierniewicense TaxID=984260 RepID=A0A7W6G4T3_9HYPH|nr:hypothetical protein [Rhizobium skierniewicense]MBB3947826.1 hypothetical protein [Rhizobium skierniewicense]